MNVALLLQLLASLVCGLVLGTLFFGGLWSLILPYCFWLQP